MTGTHHLMRRASLAACVLALTLAAGCGSASPQKKSTKAVTGPTIFVTSGCGGCHTLAAVAGATGRAGPNLDTSRPTYARVVDTVTNGSGAMPSFSGSLTPAQIRTLARYVSSASRR